MKEKDCFDDLLKSAINDSAVSVKTSRDIFNEAWRKKEQVVEKRNYFSFKYTKKVAFITACCIAFFLGGVFTFSSDIRAAAQEVLKTIFLVDGSGKVVEKSEDEKVPVATCFRLTDANKDNVEKRLGFKINFPEKIGGFSLKEIDYVKKEPLVLIMVDDVEYKDGDIMLEKLTKAIDDDKVYEELKDYNISTAVSSGFYVDNKGNKFKIGVRKNNKKSKKDSDSEINIEDIKSSIEKISIPRYPAKMVNGKNGPNDLTKKPTSIVEKQSMYWSYNGLRYYMTVEKGSDINVAIEFLEEYIKILKEE